MQLIRFAILTISLVYSSVSSAAVSIEVFTDTGMAPFTVLFNAKDSTPVSGEIIDYRWNFTDSNSDYQLTDEGRLVGHRFDTAGDYTVSLKITDSNGGVQNGTQTIHVVAVPGNAVTFYVASNGSDSNNGTSTDTPFLTVGRASTALAAAPGGSQILFRRGDTFSTGTQWNLRSSSLLRSGPYYYRIGAYGTGDRPILTGSNAAVLYSGQPAAGVGFIAQDLDIRGSVSVSTDYYSVTEPIGYRRPGTTAILRNIDAYGYYNASSSGNVLENVHIDGQGTASPAIGTGGQYSGPQFLYMNRLELENASGHGAYLAEFGEDFLIENSNIHHNGVAEGRDGITIHGIFDNVILRKSELHHNGYAFGWDAGYASNHPYVPYETMDRFIFENNIVYSQVNFTSQLSSLTNCIIRNNIFYDNPTNTAALNFEDSASNVGDTRSNNVSIYNNVFYGTSSGVLYNAESGSTNFQFRNNIISGGSATYVIDTGNMSNTTFSNNIYYNITGSYRVGGTTRNLATWLSSGLDPNSINDNPDFIDPSTSNFGLTIESPAIDAGTTVNARYDFNGGFRPSGSAFDIGAIEYGAGGATVTCYPDADSDTYGDSASSGTSRETCNAGEVTNHTDCNDGSASIHPGATEVCGNSVDEDCSGADATCGATLTISTGSTTPIGAGTLTITPGQ